MSWITKSISVPLNFFLVLKMTDFENLEQVCGDI